MHSANGKLRGPVAQTTPDLPAARKSLEAYLPYEMEAAICFHGGMSTGDIKGQLASLVELL